LKQNRRQMQRPLEYGIPDVGRMMDKVPKTLWGET